MGGLLRFLQSAFAGHSVSGPCFRRIALPIASDTILLDMFDVGYRCGVWEHTIGHALALWLK